VCSQELFRQASGEHLFASVTAGHLRASQVCVQYSNDKAVLRRFVPALVMQASSLAR
jgi:hypothetical protein